jgi:AmmeMemoRadiSam system protein A
MNEEPEKALGKPAPLSPSSGAILIATAREAISAKLEDRAPRWPASSPELNAPGGAFVTLRSGRGPSAPLRGCIGRMSSSDSLIRVVRAMAAAAAFEDARFPPLSRPEYPGLSVEITVLSPLRSIAKVSEIEVGRHGVYMLKGWHSAVFLPQVAPEQGWDREELLVNLCYKAALPPNAWKADDAKFQVFEGQIFEEDYPSPAAE